MMYTRKLTYDAGHIFYAGSNTNLLVGLFDTTGRPVKMLTSSDAGSMMRAATARDGYLYVNYNYWNGSRWNEAMLKADTALNILYARDYELERFRVSRGIGVSDGGYMYSGGNYPYGVGGNNWETFIIKYGQEGEVGTCSGSSKPANLSEIPSILPPLPVHHSPSITRRLLLHYNFSPINPL